MELDNDEEKKRELFCKELIKIDESNNNNKLFRIN